MNHEDVREYAADLTAIAVIVGAIYMATHLISMTQEYVTLMGAASAYLLIKHSPNSQ